MGVLGIYSNIQALGSDSDMHTMGFRFKPWTDPKTIADGPSILEYLNEAADENNLRDKYNLRLKLKLHNGTALQQLGDSG